MPDAPPLDRYRLHYRGDLTGRIEGQLVGPNIFGEHFMIVSTSYEPDLDRTTARVRFATPAEVQEAQR